MPLHPQRYRTALVSLATRAHSASMLPNRRRSKRAAAAAAEVRIRESVEEIELPDDAPFKKRPRTRSNVTKKKTKKKADACESPPTNAGGGRKRSGGRRLQILAAAAEPDAPPFSKRNRSGGPIHSVKSLTSTSPRERHRRAPSSTPERETPESCGVPGSTPVHEASSEVNKPSGSESGSLESPSISEFLQRVNKGKDSEMSKFLSDKSSSSIPSVSDFLQRIDTGKDSEISRFLSDKSSSGLSSCLSFKSTSPPLGGGAPAKIRLADPASSITRSPSLAAAATNIPENIEVSQENLLSDVSDRKSLKVFGARSTKTPETKFSPLLPLHLQFTPVMHIPSTPVSNPAART